MGEMKEKANHVRFRGWNMFFKMGEEAECEGQCKVGGTIVRIVHLIETLKIQSTIKLDKL